MNSEAYPGRHPDLDVGQPTEVRTTHASWVYLGSHDVWKLKRPVDLGFLDFRSMEARRRCCEDEVRLNRRLAPEIYLGAEPVRRGAGGLTLHGDGPIVDWAVHMRRLADDDSGAARLARGRLGAEHLTALAGRLVSFHRAARDTPDAGSPAAVRANVDENFSQTECFVGDVVDRGTFDAVRDFQLGWLAAHGDVLRARVAERRVREGHGDLRLEHVYVGADDDHPAPVVIDCLEFSERLRCGDVASDAAFLAMELDAAGRPDLAAGFIARFAEASDDLGMYAVLAFYLSYRAWVRGKVAALVAADPAVPHEVRASKRLEARQRFALARAYTGGPVDTPFVIALAGLPGSGKSTFASALGRALALPVASSDLIRKSMAGLRPTARGPAELYTKASRDRTYAELLRRAGIVLDAGRGVVLDATFSTRAWRAAAADLARRHGARVAFVELIVDPAVVRARLRSRRERESVSDATDVDLERVAAGYEVPTSSEGFPVLRASGEAALPEALSWLAAQFLRVATADPQKLRAAGVAHG